MNRKSMAVLAAAATSLPLLGGLGNTPTLRDLRFRVDSVRLTGPATIANGTSANYAVTANITRDGIAPGAVIVGTQGPPPPRIRPSVNSGNTQIGFNEVDVPAGVNVITATITLRCENNVVRGDKASTGRGGQGHFLWWSWDDPAKIKAHLNEAESGEMSVLCRPG